MFTLSKSNYFVCELLNVSYQTTVLFALRPAWKLEPCLPVFKVRYRGKLISLDFWIVSMRLEGTFEILPSLKFFHKFSFEEHVLILKCFSWVEMDFPLEGGRRGYSWEFVEGVCRPVLQIVILWVYFLFNLNQLKYTFIHHRRSLENYTRFQTKMGKVYSCFQTKTTQNPFGAAHTDIMAYIREYTTG